MGRRHVETAQRRGDPADRGARRPLRLRRRAGARLGDGAGGRGSVAQRGRGAAEARFRLDLVKLDFGCRFSRQLELNRYDR